MKKQKQNLHSPVLLEEVLDVLKPQKGESYLDLTSGYGGHSEAILGRTGNFKQAVLCDRDPEAITYLTEHFSGKGGRPQNSACENHQDGGMYHIDPET